MFVLYEAKANQAKGRILSAELFGLKLLAKLKWTLMKFGGIALLHTKWHISLLRYGTLFVLTSVVTKPIPTIFYLAQM
jgi:hypothetical protein